MDKIDHIKETNFITLNETLEPIFLGHCREFYGYLLITSWISVVIAYEAYTIGFSTYASDAPNVYDKKFFIEFSLRRIYQDIRGVGIFFGYILGVTTSGIINGIMCDRYGRKTMYTYNSVLHILGSIFQMIPWYPSYIINKFLLGFSSIGILISSFLLIFEYSNSNTRIVAVCFFGCFQSFGLLLLVFLNRLLHVNWRIRDFILILLNFGFVLGIWLLPESKRWEKMMALEIKLIKLLKLIDSNIYKFDRFYKNENFKFPHSYGFLFTRRYFIHFILNSIIVTLLSPQLFWLYKFDFRQRSLRNHVPTDWWKLAVYYTSPFPLIFSLVSLIILLKITRKRKLLLFSLLFLSLFLHCLIFILSLVNMFLHLVDKTIYSIPIIFYLCKLLIHACLSSGFIIIVLLIVEQSPTNTRGAISGLLITCVSITHLTGFLIIERISIRILWFEQSHDAFTLIYTVLPLISLVFVNISQGVVNTWHDLVKSSQEYQPYMY